MERPSSQPNQSHESFRSFDVLASIDLYRYDLLTVGYIRPETQQRVCDEELSYIAEGINQPLRTEFTLQEVNGELVYFDEGRWRPYMSTLIKGLEVANLEASVDSRKTFMAERASKDLLIGYQLRQLQSGQKLRWHSSFPEKELAMYGSRFIGELGFQPARHMGFVYLAEKNSDGSLTLHSQSVDNSNEEAFVAAMLIGETEDADLETMLYAYDSVLSAKHSGNFFAGRRPETVVPEENAWAIVEQHKDLFNFYFAELEVMATQNHLSRTDLEHAKKRLTYGVWGALKERLDHHVLPKVGVAYGSMDGYYDPEISLRSEIENAYRTLSKRGEVLFGCGGAITGEAALLEASSEKVFDTIFGTSSWKKMSCPFCGDKDQWGDPCSPNQHCKACDALVIAGKVKSKGKGNKKVKAKLAIAA